MTDHPVEPDVLVIEDDEELARVLSDALESMGCRTRTAWTGAQGLREARDAPPMLVLLDLGLPDVDGLSVCRQIMALRGPRIIVVTARGEADMAEAALELGADDYVRKPFHLNELLARVRVALRRGQSLPAGLLRAGRLSVDRDRCVATVDERDIQLTATELRLLTFFAEHPGWVFSKERLLEALWPDNRETHAVQVHISNLRQKIEPDPANPAILVTIKGLGYRLETGAPLRQQGPGVRT